MSQLNQMQCRFLPLEDRVLLRVNTSDRNEFRFWLTRRFIKLLWPVLARMLAATPVARGAVDPHSRQAILAFQHETAMTRSDFSQAFEEQNAALPLGERPVLLSRVQVRDGESGRQVLCLHPEQGQGVELALDQNLLHALVRLLDEAVQKAEWEVGTLRPTGRRTGPEPMVIN